MIFGVSLNTGLDAQARRLSGDFPYPWDPRNARQILQWTIDNHFDHLLFGFELGNEQNAKYTAQQAAADIQVLHNLTLELWPDASKRPVLLGPDPHSYHNSEIDMYVKDWLKETRKLGVPIFAATHHEYTEVDSTSFTSAAALSVSGEIAAAVNASVRGEDPTVHIVGGEIGPHNGGSPTCTHDYMRWASFGDSLWYADALAAKARNGYYALCRQDYIGADYGLVDCSTGTPLPDFYTGLAFATFMGPKVLDTNTSNGTVRSYAHCAAGATDGTVAALVINLGDKHSAVSFPGLGNVTSAAVLAPSGEEGLTNATGLLGSEVALNGRVLRVGKDGQVPEITTEAVGAAAIRAPPTSISFLLLSSANHQDCMKQPSILV